MPEVSPTVARSKPASKLRKRSRSRRRRPWRGNLAVRRRGGEAAPGCVRSGYRNARVELAPGVSLELMRVPAGEFLMGSRDGAADEQPVSPVRIERAFWMASGEINNAQFACFNPAHDSRVEDKNTYQFGIHGYPANEAAQPVVRVSWQEAMAFCRWLSARTGQRFTLPTEAQWEWACRAGAATPFSFGRARLGFLRARQFRRCQAARVCQRSLHRGQTARRRDALRRLDSEGRPVQRRRAHCRGAGTLRAERMGLARPARQCRRMDALELRGVSMGRRRS